MRAIVLERAGMNPGQASALQILEDLDTGDALSTATSALGTLTKATEGTKAGQVLGKLSGAASTGAGIGAALGSVIPGVGTVIGGAVGAIGGALATLGKELFSKKTRPLRQDESAMLEKGRKDPAYAVESILYVYNRPLYDTLKASNRLPSRTLAALNKKGKLATHASDLEKRYGDMLRARFGHLTESERAILGAATVSGHAKEAYQLILTAHKGDPGHAPILPRHPRPAPAPAITPTPVFIPEPTIARAPAMLAAPAFLREPTPAPAPVVMAAQPGNGLTRALPPTQATRPSPLYHVAQQPLPVWYMAALLREVPALQQMPEARLQELAGYRGRANDVSGIDATAREYVALAGETPAGIAVKLVDNAERAQELLAANPWKDPANPRWRLPPAWFSFSDHALPGGDTAGALDDDSEEPGDTAGTSDSTRQAQTARVVTVLISDWPGQIAKRLGANGRPKWWSELKQANAHKEVLSSGEWARLYGGEVLNVPDTWPASALAVAPPGGLGGVPGVAPGPIPGLPQGLPVPIPGAPSGGTPTPSTPSTTPAAGTIDPGAVFLAQGELAVWAKMNPTTADPPDFGQGFNAFADLAGVSTPRMVSCLRSFQLWSNQRTSASPLRSDGVLDLPTRDALHAAAMQIAAAKLPSAPTAPGQVPPGQAPPSGGQAAPLPVPGLGGGFPPLPNVGPLEAPTFPNLPGAPPGVPGMPSAPLPTPPKPKPKPKPEDDDDDDSGIGALALPVLAILGGFF